MTTEIEIAQLTFVGQLQGGHVHVTVLGPGPKGNRPMCGRFAVTDKEWDRFLKEFPPPAEGGFGSDPNATLMWCIVRRGLVLEAPIEPGSLASVELPRNATIHDVDAAQMLRLLTVVDQIGEHWRAQEGVNGKLLDELAALTDGARGKMFPRER
jgi:hypothetical protein